MHRFLQTMHISKHWCSADCLYALALQRTNESFSTFFAFTRRLLSASLSQALAFVFPTRKVQLKCVTSSKFSPSAPVYDDELAEDKYINISLWTKSRSSCFEHRHSGLAERMKRRLDDTARSFCLILIVACLCSGVIFECANRAHIKQFTSSHACVYIALMCLMCVCLLGTLIFMCVRTQNIKLGARASRLLMRQLVSNFLLWTATIQNSLSELITPDKANVCLFAAS